MLNLTILTIVFAVLTLGSYATYNKDIKDSNYYLPLYLSTSLAYSILWVMATRKINTTAALLHYSLIVDVMMVVAYYLGPLIIQGKEINWQVWPAGAITIIGMFWMKHAAS